MKILKFDFAILLLFLFNLLNRHIYKICIFGLAINISVHSIYMFIKSLDEAQFKGVLILFIHNKTFCNKRKYSFSLKIIFIENEWPYYSSANKEYYLKYSLLSKCIIPFNIYKYKWNIFRFSFINCWLNKYGNNYDIYFLLDVRDTIFQKNIEEYKYKNAVYLSEDARFPFKIKDDKLNKRWINDYVKNSSIEYFTPINSGTIYGSKKYFILFFHYFVSFIKSNYINTAEQGTLNYLYYTNYFNNIPIEINKNELSIIYNMGIEVIYKKFYKNKTYKIYNSTILRLPYSTYPYIVHQYDRDKNYYNKLRRKYLKCI